MALLTADDLSDASLDALTAQAVPGPKPAATGRRWAVSTEHPIAVHVGARTLEAGGTVADALVSVVAAMQVIIPGTATLAGTFSAVIHERSTGLTHALNAGYDAPGGEFDGHDPYDHARDRTTGRSVLVPGALRGLEAAWERFGRLPWADLWEPAVALAQDGFPVYPRYHLTATGVHEVLTRHPTGRALFAVDGGVPAPGQRFRQPVLAGTLQAIATDGADHCYLGPWASAAVEVVQELGGRLSLEDLAAYEARWQPALVGYYAGVEVRTNVPPQSGGASLLTALNVADVLGLHDAPSRTDSVDVLADLIGTYRAAMPHVFFGPDVYTDVQDADPSELERLGHALSREHAVALAADIRAGRVPATSSVAGGHSHNVVAADADGNLLACTWTVYGQTWGETGLFPGGICLASSAFALEQRRPKHRGGRVIEPLSVYVAVRDDEPVLAASAIGVGLQAAHLQLAVDVLGRGVPVDEAVAAPRFGAFVRDYRTMLSHGGAVLVEAGFGAELLEDLTGREEIVVGGGADTPVPGTDTGSLAAVARDPSTAQVTVVTDPRHVGAASAG
ncbi:MAG TPA: gamma-glutamyltransferase [Nitriliruptorales bacterium]